ncbi:MAG: ATP-dependent Clp protease adaptor ClpS [Bacteroidetes bacterium]|nr:ATP-dependent Clp protease adaptor ClpS [Bacteroidota bacterium]
MVKENPRIIDEPVELDDSGKVLVLHNDDHNTFDYVIESLIEVCGHEFEQAEQCALTTHTKGKCDIKKGELSILKSLHNEMGRRGLTTSID